MKPHIMKRQHSFSFPAFLAVAIAGLGGSRAARAAEPVAELATHPPAPSATSWGGFVEYDIGVLAMSGGLGLFSGPTYGPFRVGVGFYRFDSPIRALSGAPEGFELKVNYIVAADVSWHFLEREIEGPYVRVMAQVKQQQVENRSNGVRRDLDSFLIGPELGWTIRVYRGLYLAPRLGALYYAKNPQGPDNHPIDVGGKLYDNEKHSVFDLFATAGVGYAF